MLSRADLLCVPPDRVREFWPHVEPLIRGALERTELSDPRDIERDILSGSSLLWLAWADGIEAAAASQVVRIGEKKVCIITACGGANRERWLPLIEGIENYARIEGCSCVRIYGRKGWLRVLGGYEAKHVIMDKDLT